MATVFLCGLRKGLWYALQTKENLRLSLYQSKISNLEIQISNIKILGAISWLVVCQRVYFCASISDFRVYLEWAGVGSFE